jgi:hypothetical protein
LGGGAEVGAFHGADDVSVPIDEAHELLKTPKKEEKKDFRCFQQRMPSVSLTNCKKFISGICLD